MKRLLHLFYLWLPPVFWMALIFFLSSRSSLPDFEDFDFAMKKSAHFTVYAILFLLFFRAFYAAHPEERFSFFRGFLCPAGAAVLYAISDEIHQAFVPFRTPALRDVMIDTAGVVTMGLVLWKWQSFRTALMRWGGGRRRVG
jgi:hypothetical protein